ncbi:probable purine permease 11 isoform X2 [Rutidosis leptorrhynchoides]|uniref:probable purine permease 11 isoform X2 n=1 Tax=Rutidosis leptorrhynchoides TaxID=125765 RepID=UPI003A98E4C4
MPDNEDSLVANNRTRPGLLPLGKLTRWQWWLLVAANIFLLLFGQIVAVLLGRFYYDQGGNSKWMATLVQTIGFPILFIPYFLFPSSKKSSATINTSFSLSVIFSIYIILGAVIAGDNMLYSVGLLYLSASTYSLICATQLAFNAVFSYFINSQKFTVLIFNSVVVLSLSASLLSVNDDSDKPSGVTNAQYVLGFVVTLIASAFYALLLSVTQLCFQKVIKKETFSVVLELSIYTSFFATCFSIFGLFASGEWRTLGGELNGFGKGSLAYVMTFVGTAVACQVCSVGVVGLIFLVSSLFSNVISTLSLSLTPLAAVIVLHAKMNGVKIIAMLMGLWGFCTYIYQNYLDDDDAKKKQTDATVSSDTFTPLLHQ